MFLYDDTRFAPFHHQLGSVIPAVTSPAIKKGIRVLVLVEPQGRCITMDQSVTLTRPQPRMGLAFFSLRVRTTYVRTWFLFTSFSFLHLPAYAFLPLVSSDVDGLEPMGPLSTVHSWSPRAWSPVDRQLKGSRAWRPWFISAHHKQADGLGFGMRVRGNVPVGKGFEQAAPRGISGSGNIH